MTIRTKRTQDFKIILELNEQEAGALHDIVAYGFEEFLKAFKEKLGKSYIEKHESGLKSLFEIINKEMPQHLSRFNQAREIFIN